MDSEENARDHELCELNIIDNKSQVRENDGLDKNYGDVPPNNPNFSSVWRDWWWEISCCVVAVLALIAIPATVIQAMDKPLPQWPYSLSINSLISVYIVVLKASMLLVLAQGLGQLKWIWFKQTRPLQDIEYYDDASRGPLGAMNLIWTLKGRHIVASIGAFITIASLVIDPFTQQFVKYYDCIVDSAENATIPRTSWYISIDNSSNTEARPISETISQGLQVAINNGFYGGAITPLQFNCASGNCSFIENYSTLGYCGNCSDVSSQLNISSQLNTTVEHRMPSSNFTLPSGLRAYNPWETFVMAVNINKTLYYNIPAVVELILGYENYTATGAAKNCSGPSEWNCRGYGAAECWIYPCVKTYNGKVNKTKLMEVNSTESSYNGWGPPDENGSKPGEFYSIVNSACLNEFEKSLLKDRYNVSLTWIPYMTNSNQSDFSSIQDALYDAINPACVYQVNDRDLFPAQLHFQKVFSLTSDWPSSNLTFPFIIPSVGNMSFPIIQDTFKNVTDSMTNYIRQNGQDSSYYAMGQVKENKTCVGMRWSWLILAFVLVLFTLVFFVAMVLDTGSDRVGRTGNPIYKSSVLALMMHGLEMAPERQMQPRRRGKTQLDNDVRGIYVKFQETERGWRFVEAES